MKFLPNKILFYHLYLYQLEEYDTNRFLKALANKGILPPSTLRKKAKMTGKAKLMLALTLFQQIFVIAILAYLLEGVINNFALLAVLLGILLYIFFAISFIFLIQSKDLLSPLDFIVKQRMIRQAKQKLAALPNLKIIGITGSYGKTTMKETVYEFLKEQYKVVKTEGNNNTPLGISRTILNKLNKDTDFFVVEMGEYVKGDVRALCQIASPDISIITGINEAHLERYLTMENAISTKFEIVEYAKPNAIVLLNADDQLTVENYKKFVKDNRIEFFSAKNNTLCNYKVSDYTFDQNGKGQSFRLTNKETELGIIKTSILGEYIIGNIIAGYILGKELNIADSKLKYAANNLKGVEHRLEPIYNNQTDILVIDDTYNGNSDGFKEGINLLSKFKQRRKVYVTPGLVETANLAESLHLQIGKDLASVADLVILVKNSVTPFIAKGLTDNGYKEDKIVWYDNSKNVWEELNNNILKGDVVMLQNDWSDNYY